MSRTVMVLSLHPQTRRSIEIQGVPPACGCRGMADPALMSLCDYHEGYDDGIDVASGGQP